MSAALIRRDADAAVAGVLDALPEPPARLTSRLVLAMTAAAWGAEVRGITGPHRSPAYARPRFAAIWVVRATLPLSLPEIGRRIGDRDHTTILHALRRAERLRGRDCEFAARTDAVLHAANRVLDATRPKGDDDEL